MDVQTENTDPPPNESQPSGKIRKGFKLFGKRKPGNIFSIRSKGDGNNKSPVISSKALDGLSETHASNSETEKENGQEVGQGEKEHTEDEMLAEDGVLASAPARTSISSASSAKSLSFLSLLRGGRRGAGDRRVQTVSQSTGRQRRGLKGLFGSVRLRSKDKEDKEEAPPSPLLMSSRSNSVEIIKEDLTLTPKCQARSLNSPETESSDPVQNSTTNNSEEMSPSESSASQETAVSRTKEQPAPSPTSDPPLVPSDTSLSSLLADISSLLTFDSISGGDILADVEAEWGKASSDFTSSFAPSSFFSKPTVAPPTTTSTTISVAAAEKPSSWTVSSSASTFTTFNKPSALMSHSVKPSSGFDSSSSVQDATKPSTTAAASTTASSAPLTSFTSKTIHSTSSFGSFTTVPVTNTLSTMNKAPLICSGKLTSETATPPQNTASVSKSASAAVSAKPSPVTQSVPSVFTQPPAFKSDTVCNSNLEKSSLGKTSQISAAGESPATGSVASCVVTTKPSSSASAHLSNITTVSSAATTSAFVSTDVYKPSLTSTHVDLSKTPSSFVTLSAPSSTLTATKTQPGSSSVPAPPSTSLDRIPATTKSTAAPVYSDKMPPPYAAAPSANTHAVSTAPHATALSQIKISASGVSPAPAQMQISVSKELPASAQVEVSQSKAPPAEVPVFLSKDPSAPVKMQVSSSKAPPSPTEVPVSVSKPPPASAQIPISQPKTHPAPPSAPYQAASPPTPWPSETPAMTKMKGTGHASVDHQWTSLDGAGGQGNQAVLSKTKELQNELQASLQGPPKEKKPPQSKASGLSKIPVVGGGRVGKLPVQESQHGNDDSNRDPPTPVQEDRPSFNSHDAGRKDKISPTEANAPTSKPTQEESQQLQQPKSLTSSGRDSKIPVKHGAQPQTSKDTPRTKIPVSKVPVRRTGNKPAATGGTNQMRK